MHTQADKTRLNWLCWLYWALTSIYHVPLIPAQDEQIASWMESFYSTSPWRNSSTKMLFWSHLQFVYAMNRILLIEHWKTFLIIAYIINDLHASTLSKPATFSTNVHSQSFLTVDSGQLLFSWLFFPKDFYVLVTNQASLIAKLYLLLH